MRPTTINADTSDPIIIALRSKMKERFLLEFARIDHTLDWDDAELIVYGSTLMHSMHTCEGILFPLQRTKSSDIDIGVFQKASRPLSTKQFTENITKLVAPLVKKAIKKSGFGFRPPKKYRHEEVTATANEDIEQLGNRNFLDAFFVTQSFSPEDIRETLQGLEDFAELETFIPDEPLEVRLVLDVNEAPFPILLDAISVPSPNQDGEYNRCQAMDMLAGKIARCMTSHRKETDLIDIYRLLEARRSDGSNVLNLDPEDPENDIDTLRVLIITYMNFSREIHPTSLKVDTIFEPSASRIEKLVAGCQEQISSIKINELRDMAAEILSVIDATYRGKIFTERSEPSYGLLNFTEAEMHYHWEINGRLFQPHKPKTPQNSLWTMLSLSQWFGKSAKAEERTETPSPAAQTYPRKHNITNPTLGESTEPRINIQKMTEQYPHVFQAHPELMRNITSNDILRDKTNETRTRQASLQSSPVFGE